jgi:hypothetical protein
MASRVLNKLKEKWRGRKERKENPEYKDSEEGVTFA